MNLYYLPLLIRSDRYFVARLDKTISRDAGEYDFNFVAYADDRVLTPLITLEDPSKVSLNQMGPSGNQDIPLKECRVSLQKNESGIELIIEKSSQFQVESSQDEESGLRLDYSAAQKRMVLGFYKSRVEMTAFPVTITFRVSEEESYSGSFLFSIVPSLQCHRVVIDFGSEASQIGYKNCGPEPAVMQYDILENVISQLSLTDNSRHWKREDFLNNEPGQPLLYRSFYAVKKKFSGKERENFPFNFSDKISGDEIRLFITRQEIAATQVDFRDNYEIVPNLKLGIEKSLQLSFENRSEDYSIRSHKKELISAVLLRMLRLMISTKPGFQHGGIIVTLLVPNIYTQHDVFELLNELRKRTAALLHSLQLSEDSLYVEYETISESDAAFMGYQQTHAADIKLANGEMALVIDCGKGTTDISMLLADDNENYSSFFRTGFAGAGNVLSYGFAEDFLTLLLRAIPGSNAIAVKDFINRHILGQNLTADVLNFIQFIEDCKKNYNRLQPVGLVAFAQIAEDSQSTERRIGTLYKDQATLLQYAEAILKNRNIRWDEEVTGLISKATDCIVHSIVASIKDVLSKDIRRRIRVVMLSGRAFYFDELRAKLEAAMKELLGETVALHTVPSGRSVNNKNIAVYGAFSGAYKITDFTGIPIDKKEGLSKNNDVLNNNLYLYRGIKIEPGNDILYNTSLVRRNNQQLTSFRNKTMDVHFTRDNIYLRLMDNQRVKDVRSLNSILTAAAEVHSPLQDMKTISMFPACNSEPVPVALLHDDMMKQRENRVIKPVKKRQGILQFFQF